MNARRSWFDSLACTSVKPGSRLVGGTDLHSEEICLVMTAFGAATNDVSSGGVCKAIAEHIVDLLLLNVRGFLETLADVVVIRTRFARESHRPVKGLNNQQVCAVWAEHRGLDARVGFTCGGRSRFPAVLLPPPRAPHYRMARGRSG